MKLWMTVVAVFALAGSATAMAQNSTEPDMGTWILNLAKSKYDPAALAPKSETRTLEQTPDGMIHETIQVERADGQISKQGSTLQRNGKPFRFTGNPNLDTIEVTRINSQAITITQLLKGKVIGYQVSSLSADGKVLTLKRTITTATGETQHDVRIYDRQ